MPIPIAMDIPNIDKATIEINGVADESVWSQARTIEGFTTVRPEPDLPADRETTVRVFLSEEALYLHFEAIDDDPKAVYGGFGRRDSRTNDDYVGVLLDPLATGERGAIFIANPLGVQMDGTLVRGRAGLGSGAVGQRLVFLGHSLGLRWTENRQWLRGGDGDPLVGHSTPKYNGHHWAHCV